MIKENGRKEDSRLIRGQGLFVDDEQSPKHLHVRLVRSPYAHAKILAVHIEEAAKQPGVVCIITAEDVLAFTKPFPQMAPPPASGILDYCMAVETV